jgi:hypothetical protein
MTMAALPLLAVTLETLTYAVKHLDLVVTQMILEVTICVFESVIISVLPAPSVLDSLVKTPPMVFTVAAAQETIVVDAVHSKPCT